MQAGVKVYFYKKGFLHSKLMVSDDMLSTVGSNNVDLERRVYGSVNFSIFRATAMEPTNGQ